MTSHFVSTREEMTASWFDAILRESGALTNAKVESAELERVTGGVMNNMVRAKLRYTGNTSGPASMIVKYPSDDPGNLSIAKTMGLYELEVRFYTEVAPELKNLSLPKCYYARMDQQSGRFVLAIEDLGESTISGAAFETLTEEQCSGVFRELAFMQAPLWDSPKKPHLDWLYDDARTLAIFDVTPAGLEPFLARFGNSLNPDHIKLFETVLPKSGQWARSNVGPRVLQHAEFRSANVLFGAKPGAPAVTVIDFQTVRIGAPGVDPAYFMGASLPTDHRRKIEEDVIREYHQRLLKLGVVNFDWNACWNSYCDGALYGVFLLVGMAASVEPSEQNDRIILNLVDRCAAMALDLDSARIAGLA